MTFLPIVERELRVATRRKRTFYTRWLIALVSVLVGGMALFMMLLTGVSANQTGIAVFALLSYYLLGLCLLAGVFLAGDCLSEERREGTLGLLFLTDLKGYDIVLGKLLAVSLNAFYGLLAVFPILGISIVIGGVSGAEFWRVCLALLNSLWFSVTLALWASARSESSSRSAALWCAGFIVLNVLLPGLESLFPALNWPFGPIVVSPITAFACAREKYYVIAPKEFWLSLAISNLLGWLFLFGASRRVGQFTELGSSVQYAGWRQRVFKSDLFLGKRRRIRALLEKNPVHWLLTDSSRLRVTIWAVAGIGCVVLAGYAYGGGTGGMSLVYAAKPFYFVLQILFAMQSCRFFADARRDGTLELLATTPLTDSTVYYGQAAALIQQFLWPVVALASVEFICITALVVLPPEPHYGGGDVMTLLFLLPWQLLSSGAEFYAVAWFGMWLALTSKKPQSAAGWTVLFVIVLPELALCIPSFFISLTFLLICQNKLRRDYRLVFADAEARRR